MPVRSVFSWRDVAEITRCSNLQSLVAGTKGEEDLGLIYVGRFVWLCCSSVSDCLLNGNVIEKETACLFLILLTCKSFIHKVWVIQRN